MEAPTPLPASAEAGANAGVHLTHRQILLVFSGLMLGMFLSALDQTIVNTALQSIVSDLGGQSQLTWVVTSYLLTSTITILLWGKLSDIYGRKLMFQIAIGLFLAASALVGLSPTMMFLVIARGIQGIGAGGIMSLAFAIIGDILSPRERGKYMGLMGSVFVVSMIIGPALGGLIVDHLHLFGVSPWRWVFYINLPIGIPALFITQIVLKLPFHRRKEKVDYLGFGLLTLGTSALILGLTWAGQPSPWDATYNLRWLPGVGRATPGAAAGPGGIDGLLGDWLITGLLSLGALVSALFLLVEKRTEHALLPMRLFKTSQYKLGSAVSFVVGAGMFAGFVFLPTYLQMSTGVSATMSGFLMLPMMAGMFPFMTASGILISKTGRYKFWPLVGLPTSAAGMLLLSTVTAGTSLWLVGFGMFLMGAGIGMTMQVMVVVVQNVLEMRDLGIGTSANTFLRQMGAVFGVGIFGAYFGGRVIDLARGAAPIAARNGVDASTIGSTFSVNAHAVHDFPQELRDYITGGFADIIGNIFLYAAPLMLLGWALAFFIKEIPLRSTRGVGGGPAVKPGPESLAKGAEKAVETTAGAPVLAVDVANGSNGRNGRGNGHAAHGASAPGRAPGAIVAFTDRSPGRQWYMGYEISDLQARVDQVTRRR
ncbi:MAG: MDR family MFS transporter [Thermoplasmatota archaeon]